MSKRLLLFLVLPLIVIVVAPTLSWADASVVQDSCVTFVQGGKQIVRIYFTLVNFSLPEELCAVSFLPEPLPVLIECEMINCGMPAGWTCFLTPFGGSDYFANTLGDCVAIGTAKGGFFFDLDPGFCCYVVQFLAPDGAVMLEQEECFTLCGIVGTEEKTWGDIKEDYKKLEGRFWEENPLKSSDRD
jgi:hypothetical protein